MTRMTGKRALMEMLRAESVKYIFGNPGTSESAILDALEDYPDIEYVLTDAGKGRRWVWRTLTRARLRGRRS